MTFFNALLTFENASFREYILCVALLIIKAMFTQFMVFTFQFTRGCFEFDEDLYTFARLFAFLPLYWIQDHRMVAGRTPDALPPLRKGAHDHLNGYPSNGGAAAAADDDTKKASGDGGGGSGGVWRSLATAPEPSHVERPPADAYVLRLVAASRSDLKHDTQFALAAFLYVLSGLRYARLHFYAYTLCRFMYTVVTLFLRVQPWRTLCTVLGTLCTLSMCIQLFFAALLVN